MFLQREHLAQAQILVRQHPKLAGVVIVKEVIVLHLDQKVLQPLQQQVVPVRVKFQIHLLHQVVAINLGVIAEAQPVETLVLQPINKLIVLAPVVVPQVVKILVVPATVQNLITKVKIHLMQLLADLNRESIAVAQNLHKVRIMTM